MAFGEVDDGFSENFVSEFFSFRSGCGFFAIDMFVKSMCVNAL